MQPDLPEGYYLNNVKTLFDHVEAVYTDILEPEYLDFLQGFYRLSDDSQKLIIRLLNRSGELFRRSKLNYPEIGSIDTALQELNSTGFIELVTDLDKSIILSLFNKTELIEQSANKNLLKKLNRAELEELLLAEADNAYFQNLIDSDQFIQIIHKDTYLLLQMLFFGNLNQSMTDFVLRDLGLYQFENYRIDTDNRPYQNTEQVNQHWLLHQLDGVIELTDADNIDILLDCFNAIPECHDQTSPVYRKSERLKYELTRQLERLGELDTAFELYRQCRLPPSRERRVRILHQQGEIKLAIKLCSEIIGSPLDDAETQFAEAFAARLIKQHKLDPLPGLSTKTRYQPDVINLVLEQHPQVELAVADHYRHDSTHCFYLENALFNGVLGLLIWEAIFAPVAGAFYNPFQYRPSDFYSFDFVQKRQEHFERIWFSIKDNDDIWQQVSNRWQEKLGLANPLVDWQNLNLEVIELALQRIDHQHWLRIFERILLDLRNNRSGFPDLILFPETGGYQLIEVKGPGDTLQKNQQRWMQYFSEHQIPHLLAKVSWL